MSSPFPPEDIKVRGVAELTREVRQVLEGGFASVWVEGEVSNLARPASGHLYLTLKDDKASLRTVVFRGVALRMRFDLRDGLTVIAQGRLTVYEPRGEYQLQVEQLQPKGIGPLELAFRQLKEKLLLKGYFDPRRKKPLPPFPRRIALVTSGTGSAVRDMLETLDRRWPAAEVWVCPVRVQGETAAGEIAHAVQMLNVIAEEGNPIDLILLARGGGSLEDLWPFNEEVVAEAIVASTVPVVTGVGHEDDYTIADMVADLRALTPTDAATRVTPDRAELLTALEQTWMLLRTSLAGRIERARGRLDDLAGRRCLREPLARLRDEERRLDEWAGRLARAGREQLRRVGERVSGQASRLETLCPLNVLARGYSLTRREDDSLPPASGAVLRDARHVQPGDLIRTRLHSGSLRSRVVEVVPDESLVATECSAGPTGGPHHDG